MANHLDLKDTANVTFYNLKTGEKIEMTTISTDVFPINSENYISGGNGNKLLFSQEQRAVELTNLHINGAMLALFTGLDNDPEIKRLVKLYNRAKRKRVKEKLNKRILEELGKHDAN